MSSKTIGFTQIDVKKSQFTWKINNFKYLYYCIDTGKRLESPTFTVKPDDGILWRLFLWPHGVSSDFVSFLSASLAASTTNSDCNVYVKFALSVIDSNGKKCYERSKDNAGSIVKDSFDGFNEFILKKDLEAETCNILPNDVLTVHCDLTLVYKNSVEHIDESVEQQRVELFNQNKILSAFEQQLHKGEFSDVKLVALCGKELFAHKFVLAAQSPVFSAMFTNDMEEKHNNLVTINDIDHDSLKEMLLFMYAGRVENLDKLANGILAAQEKYQIDGLKEFCEEYFYTNIHVENAVEILALSIRYNMDKIKLLAEKFIQCHAKSVSDSASFKAIDEPNLLAEIVRILANV